MKIKIISLLWPYKVWVTNADDVQCSPGFSGAIHQGFRNSNLGGSNIAC